MKIVYEYSHLGGAEILQVRYPQTNQDIYEVIAHANAARTKISKIERLKRHFPAVPVKVILIDVD